MVKNKIVNVKKIKENLSEKEGISVNSSNKDADVKENLSSKRKAKEKHKTFRILSLNNISMLVFIFAIFLFTWKNIKWVPELPKVDLNKWWGPNDTRDLQDVSIRKYRIFFSDAMIDDVYHRFDYNRRYPLIASFNDTAWTYGAHSEALKEIFEYWQFKYNFRERQRYLNKFDQYMINIQGLNIHFIHVKPKVDENVKVLPLLLLHGWPSSVRDFYHLIPKLTAIRPGYDFVLEVIAPSLPGFIFSDAPARPGLCQYEMAIILRNLMQRLGFSKFYIQGGDFGHHIGSDLAVLFPNEVLGFHSNFLASSVKLANLVWIVGSIWPSLVERDYTERMYPLREKIDFYLEEFGYVHLQATKPDTIGIALQDSPLGLAAYILDRFVSFTDPNNKHLKDGGLSSYSKEDLLDNIMLYWFSGSITSSMRLYKEGFGENEGVIAQIPTTVPTWGLRLKHELMFQPEFVLKWKYPNLLGTTTVEHGGHYPALEDPALLADDVFLAIQKFQKIESKV